MFTTAQAFQRYIRIRVRDMAQGGVLTTTKRNAHLWFKYVTKCEILGIAFAPVTFDKFQAVIFSTYSNSQSLVSNMFDAINFVMVLNGLPLFPRFWSRVAPGQRRFHATTPRHSKPVLPEMAMAIYTIGVTNQLLAHQPVTDLALHECSLILIQSVTWSRFNCLTHINLPRTMQNISSTAVEIWFDKRKFKPYPCHVKVARGNAPHSPLAVLRRWIQRFDMHHVNGKHIFLRTINNRYNPSRVENRPMSYDQYMKVLRKWLKKIGINDIQNYSTHGLRIGGVTQANADDVPPNAIQRHGMWVNAETQVRYDSLTGRDTLTSAPYANSPQRRK